MTLIWKEKKNFLIKIPFENPGGILLQILLSK